MQLIQVLQAEHLTLEKSYSTQTVGGLKFNLYKPVEAHGNVEIYYHQILCRLCMTWTRRNLSIYIPAASIELQVED